MRNGELIVFFPGGFFYITIPHCSSLFFSLLCSTGGNLSLFLWRTGLVRLIDVSKRPQGRNERQGGGEAKEKMEERKKKALHICISSPSMFFFPLV